jgi:hypothetical protein
MTDEDLSRVTEVVREAFARRGFSPVKGISTPSESGEPRRNPLGVARAFVRERLMTGTRVALDVFDRRIGRHGGARLAAVMLGYAPILAVAFYLAYGLRWDLRCLTILRSSV